MTVYIAQWMERAYAFNPCIGKTESYSKEAALKKVEGLVLPHREVVGDIEIFTTKEYCDSILDELKTIGLRCGR